MFFDRYYAKRDFEKIESNINREWITVSGNKGIGKSSFIKEILKENISYIYCEPIYELMYWKNFYNQIKKYSQEIIITYTKKFKDKNNLLEKYGKFTIDIEKEDYEEILENIIQEEVSKGCTVLSKIIGMILAQNVNYIVLDNLYLCDSLSFEWLVSLSEKFITGSSHIIAVCDMNLKWKSKEVKTVFSNTMSNIDISVFDDYFAYYNLLDSKIYFNNGEKLKKISRTLYNDFNGDSQLIFKLIENVIPKIEENYDDNIKEIILYKTAGNLLISNLMKLNLLEKNILAVLSNSPVPISISNLIYILDHEYNIIRTSIDSLIEKDLVEIENNIDLDYNNILYRCTTTFSKNTYKNLVNESTTVFFLNKIYILYKKNQLQLSSFQLIELILKIKPENISEQIYTYINNYQESIDDEQKAYLINMAIKNSENIHESFQNIETIELLYRYGYYLSAKNIFSYMDDFSCNYSILMKYGDILHLTLDSETALIFKKASKLENITVSDKLSAINRQIMAMTQQGKEELKHARIIYQNIIDEYSNYQCHGLIELYRNANNIFDYSKALEYTITGYNLACSLDDNIERIKCLHNICMLELLNDTYDSDDIPDGLISKPSFKDVYEMLSEYPYFRHETAYPLLDMATHEMFIYDKNDDFERIKDAKSLYSEAQLYAKSFYAKNIAEMGLLITNSYLYKENPSVKNLRNNLFESYQNKKDEIHDFRVHRKILFSLATSAKITNDLDESREYLRLSKKYVFEGEILRYNNLCDALEINDKLPLSELKFKNIRSYHKTIKFVPWLISFGH